MRECWSSDSIYGFSSRKSANEPKLSSLLQIARLGIVQLASVLSPLARRRASRNLPCSHGCERLQICEWAIWAHM